jgi:hypothetical protein
MTTNKTLVIILLLFVVTLGAVTGLHALDNRDSKRQMNTKKEEPTVLGDAEPSARQKEHGKLFKHAGRKLQDIASSQPGDVEVIEEEGYVIQMPKTSRVPTFMSALCNADAVVVGILKSKSSQLTEQGNFIFTDYEVIVDELIKNNLNSPIEVGSTIITTRDGGAIRINDRVLRAKRADFDPPVVGNRYLLFLRFIPKTSSYLMYGNGSFELQGDKMLALGPQARQELKQRATQDPLIFLNELRAFDTRDCSKN